MPDGSGAATAVRPGSATTRAGITCWASTSNSADSRWMANPPVDARALEASLRPHGESVMLPRAAYVDPDVLAWERRHFFAGTWTCLGRVDELSSGTTY